MHSICEEEEEEEEAEAEEEAKHANPKGNTKARQGLGLGSGEAWRARSWHLLVALALRSILFAFSQLSLSSRATIGQSRTHSQTGMPPTYHQPPLPHLLLALASRFYDPYA